MQIFPRNNHFKVVMYTGVLVGLWPFVFEDNQVPRRLYKYYSIFILCVFGVFHASTYTEVFMFISSGVAELHEIFANLCLTLLYSIIIMKAVVMKTPSMVGLLREAIDVEEMIYRSKDDEVTRIYEINVKKTSRSCILFIVSCSVVASSYLIVPIFNPVTVFDEATNETMTMREMPLPAWIPWDNRKHYWITYCWLSYAGTIAATYVTFMDIYMYSVIIYPLGQLDILLHTLRSFGKYALDTQRQLGCSREDASFLTLQNCVVKHKEIIRYVNIYNEGVRYIMVFDFLVSSIQLAATALEVAGAGFNFYDLLHWGSFMWCMILRLLTYYWFANEVMLKSLEVGSAIWESEWYEEPNIVKQLMLIMILRSQRALSLEIGPFSTMTLESFLKIVKAAYSYLMIMYR